MKQLIAILFLLISLKVSAGWVFDANLRVWYNTETGEIVVVGDDDADDDVGSIIIYNSTGQKESSMQESSKGEKTIRLDGSGLETGFYFVFIENKAKTKSITKKIFIP